MTFTTIPGNTCVLKHMIGYSIDLNQLSGMANPSLYSYLNLSQILTLIIKTTLQMFCLRL